MKKVISMIVCLLVLFGICTVSISAQTDADESEAQLIDVPEGYHLFEFAELLAGGGLNVVQNDSAATISTDEENGGIIISGTPDEIAGLQFSLAGEIDLGSYTAGRLVFNALCEQGFDSFAEVCLDNDASKAVAISAAKQSEPGNWAGEKNNCADISALELSGQHTVSFKLKFGDDAEDQDTQVLLKNMLFIAYSVPVVDVNIDESKGTIEAMNADEDHLTRCYGNITISVPEDYESEYGDEKPETATYELDYIRGRGNSTWLPDKKPYKFKLKKKANLLGMGANKHWGLIANYYDYTLLRNKYTYWLGAKMGMAFTPKCVFVDVVMNGSYLGSYSLSELVRVDKSRVDIDDLEDTPEVTDGEELTGGYLISMDRLYDDFMIETDRYTTFRSESPDFEENFVEAQYNYIKDYLNKTENAIYSDDLCDPDGVPYTDYLDVDSMIDYFIVQGTSENGDAFVNGSTYLYKERGGKLHWGPLWDFDYVAWWANAMEENVEFGSYRVGNYPWFKQIFLNDPEFKEKFIARLKEVDEIIRQSAQDGGQVDTYAKQVYLSQYANHLLIPIDTELYLSETVVAGGVTYDSEIERLKKTLIKRADWQDTHTDEIVLLFDDRQYAFMVDDEHYATLEKESLNAYSFLLSEPEKENYIFAGWFIRYNDVGEISIDEYVADYLNSDIIPGERVFYAKWTAKAAESTEPAEATEATEATETVKPTEAVAAATESGTTAPTAAAAAGSSTTNSSATANSGAVQTGQGGASAVVFLALIAAVGILMAVKFKHKNSVS